MLRSSPRPLTRQREKPIRLAVWFVVILASAATIVFNAAVLHHVARAATRVPWADEWPMIEQYSAYCGGASLWQILWTPYWGHRLVIPRLIIFADLRWASEAPLTWLTLVIQFAHIALLVALARRLFRGRPRICLACSTIVILNLMLSPTQMQNFAWNMQSMFPLVYAAGSAAFFCLALSDKSPAVAWALSATAAIIGSLTMPDGTLIWPVLLAQSIYLKRGRRFTGAVALIGSATLVLYLWDYHAPPVGMGIAAMIRHPIDALCLMGYLLGAPFDFLPLQARISLALAAVAAAGYLLARVLRRDPTEGRGTSTLAAIYLFLLLSAASTVAGRFKPEWMYLNGFVVPPKYFTLICCFWTTVALVALYAWRQRMHGLPALSLWGAIFFCLMFLRPAHLLGAAEDWADFFRGVDALGGALILDAHDEQLLGRLLDTRQMRTECVAFLHRRHIGVFAEQRAAWPGKLLTEIVQGRELACAGGVESVSRLTASDSGPFRLEGWAVTHESDQVPDNLVFIDPQGQVVGLARGGFRHRYIPGLIYDPGTAVFHDGVRRSEWLGYVRESAQRPWTVYGIFPRGFCRVASVP